MRRTEPPATPKERQWPSRLSSLRRPRRSRRRPLERNIPQSKRAQRRNLLPSPNSESRQHPPPMRVPSCESAEVKSSTTATASDLRFRFPPLRSGTDCVLFLRPLPPCSSDQRTDSYRLLHPTEGGSQTAVKLWRSSRSSPN